MRYRPVASVLTVLVAIGATGLAVGVVARGVVVRWLGTSPGGVAPEEVLAELETRIALTAGIVACLGVAAVLAASRLGAGSRPPPPEAGSTGRPSPATEPPAARGGVAGTTDVGGRVPEAGEALREELEGMRRRLARTERIAARREVARQVAHEIKNPLAPIRASVETLRRLRDRGSPEFDEYFDEATRTVLAEVRRIAAIVTEFSEFARMPSPRFAKIPLIPLLRGVATLHDAPGVTGGPRVRVEADSEPLLLADEDQLTRAFTNLVQNGIEAARAAGETPRVTFEVDAARADEVRVRVRDNGPGVEPSIRERLFEPYVTTKREGTGLGLAIVQTIVHEHGGEVRLRDDVGGAVFEVSLPVEGPRPLERAPAITQDPRGN